jgi:hypothetical protein
MSGCGEKLPATSKSELPKGRARELNSIVSSPTIP